MKVSQCLLILIAYIFPYSPFWLACNEMLSTKVLLFSLCLHYTWLYCICPFFFVDGRLILSGFQMLHVLGRLALVIFLVKCVTSDDSALYTCQPGATPPGVTPAPNRKTMFLTFLPLLNYTYSYVTCDVDENSVFLYSSLKNEILRYMNNTLFNPNNIIVRIILFVKKTRVKMNSIGQDNVLLFQVLLTKIMHNYTYNPAFSKNNLACTCIFVHLQRHLCQHWPVLRHSPPK